MGRRTPLGALAAALVILGACSTGAGGPTTGGTAAPGSGAPATAGGGASGTAPGTAAGAGSTATGPPQADLPTPDPSAGPGDLAWTTCKAPVVSLCATVAVPLDHADPTGPTIDLSVELVPAARPDERIGVLWWNPGGPGMPGVSGTGGLAVTVPQVLRDRFDIATFDPRGIGESNPVDCGPAPTSLPIDLSPDDVPETQVVVARGRESALACATHSPDLLAHLGTQDVARDLDLLRAAVGDDKLTYIGMSYGTVIGQEYLALFPDKVRAMVLDGVVDASVGWEQRWTDMAMGRELAFQRFLEWCSTETACPMHGDGDAGAAFDALMAQLDAEPIPLSTGPVDQAAIEGELAQALYGGERAWYGMARSLDLYVRRDLACLDDLSCRFGVPDPQTVGTDPNVPGAPGPEPTVFDGQLDEDFSESYADGVANLSLGFDAVICIDWPMPRDEAAFAASVERITTAAPRFGRILGWAQATCLAWAAEPVGLLTPAPGPATPLVVSTTHDPATPLRHAQSVAQRLGAPLLTVDSARHVIFPSGAPCVDDAVSSYLLSATPPASSSCPMPEPPPLHFP